MAAYIELAGMYDNDTLRQRIYFAVLVAAQGILDNPTATLAQKRWAVNVLDNSTVVSNVVLKYLLAKNRASTTTQIQNVTDAVIQSGVDAIIDDLVETLQ